MDRFAGKVALVTGAAGGIGRACAVQLASEGAALCCVDYNAEALKETMAALGDTDLQKLALTCDVRDEAQVADTVKQCVDHFGRLDVLVNNAGITRDGLLMRMKTDDWQSVIDLNLSGVFLCTRAVARPMLKQKSGRIINITSVVGLMGNAGQANYAAAKAGVVGLTRSAAKEMASRGITVNAVAPGFIATDMTKNLNAEGILAAIPLGQFGTPEQVAGAVRFLAADPAAAYITGQVLQVDGGMVMG